MVVQPAPTSPKQRLAKQQADQLAQVWPSSPMVQPPKTPWGRIWLLIFVMGILTAVAVVLGWGILAQRMPESFFARWWPEVGSTTVVERITEANSTTPPAVRRVADQLFGLAGRAGPAGIYTQADLATAAVPLSTNGWFVVLRDEIPEEPELAMVPVVGQPTAVTDRIDDPSTPFTFLQAEVNDNASIALHDAGQAIIRSPVWVITAQPHDPMIVAATIASHASLAWQSSDELSDWYTLDQTVTNPAGSVVVDRSGRLVGILDDQQRVQPTSSIEFILKPLLQQSTIERTALGLAALDRGRAIVTGSPTATGWLIGNEGDQLAVREEGPAGQAGLQAGDLITHLNGQPVTNWVFETIQSFQPGDPLTLMYQREGATAEVTLQLESLVP